ncbi:transcriptional regulator [Halalkalibacillus sediminis]|uniref:Transcriptional regulator n=1 Tax=Halalkalibacillus sediminis TaxID=2018042 RepID=A0A2I0QQY2_9BACI|nr:DUF2087 domain-containing protein [Halalkalibacillus sediminis]PKR76747.1 transcriptional regulator [Halalkalibacillus sediminis]
MSKEGMFWNSTVEELSQGYIYDDQNETYICLVCDEPFECGVIYRRGDVLLEAKKAVQYHIEDDHDSMFDSLLSMDKKYTGLSDHQKELLHYFKRGLADKEIVKELDSGSPSTIRNHRFKFREKEKQAKVFLAIMNLLKSDEKENKNSLVGIHKGAKMVDERYTITVEEKEKVLSTYFDEGVEGPLSTFPSKEKRKIIVLQQILKSFKSNEVYSEKEVNEVLKSKFNDFATLRRYMIEYGFMDRSKDCTKYWVKN